MYYHINYKTFPKNTKVETFHLPLSEKEKEKLKEVISKLNNAGKSPQPLPKNAKKIERKIRIPPTRTALIAQLPGPAVIYSFKIKIAAENKRDAVRELILKMRWDGKSSPSVWSPLGDFFGSSPGINSYRSLPLGMTEDVLYCYWCMPFARSAKIEITNEGKQDVAIAYQIIYAPIRWRRNIGYFHAKWRRENPNKVFDWPFLECYGRGRYVGVMLTVWNPVRGWWGEGDEKIWVDGEKWPSTFGTGSEDYFGYAWCSTQLFTHPYHNQTLCEGPGNANYTSVNRWHITDDIPFQKSIKVTIENYGNDKEYACTTFWYADLGQKDFFHPVPLSQRKLHPPRQNP